MIAADIMALSIMPMRILSLSINIQIIALEARNIIGSKAILAAQRNPGKSYCYMSRDGQPVTIQTTWMYRP